MAMEYRTLPHGGEQISVIGMGMGSIHQASDAEIEDTVRTAMERGVNFFDFVPSEAKPFEPYARAFKGHRDEVMLQVHLGADYHTGTYGWTRDLATIKREFQARLDVLGTDYADFGFIHCMDDVEDFEQAEASGLIEYWQRLYDEGVIRHLGFSSHNPVIARKFLDMGVCDLAMISINPMYDYTDESEYGRGEASERMQLYRDFERAGVAISVMKPFAGGQLLDAATSPFKQALTRTRCIAYELDKPAVVTVLPGVRNKADLLDVLSYVDATPEERDYAVLGTFAPVDARGTCVYCNHCQPCPAGLNIGLINKYYDLALAGDAMAAGHYEKLALHAGDCAHCGHCDRRCPFGVAQSARMNEIAAYFGK